MNTTNLRIVVSAGMILVLSIVIAVTLLTWHGSISGQAAVAIYGAIIGGGGVSAVMQLATQTGAEAASGRFRGTN